MQLFILLAEWPDSTTFLLSLSQRLLLHRRSFRESGAPKIAGGLARSPARLTLFVFPLLCRDFAFGAFPFWYGLSALEH